MIPYLAAALLLQGVAHVRSVLPLDGRILQSVVADANGDGLSDLLVARSLPQEGREVDVFFLRPDGAFPAVPDRRIEIKVDVICWGVGEFRPDDPGIELLLTTRSGAYTLSPRKNGYGGNIRKLAGGPMLFDLPSERALPLWTAIADVDGDGIDEVALLTLDGVLVVRPTAEGGQMIGSLSEVSKSRSRPPAAERAFLLGNPQISSQPLSELFVPDDDPGLIDAPPTFSVDDSMPIPFFRDLNGDGLLDLVYYDGGYLFGHFQVPAPAQEAQEDGRPLFSSPEDFRVYVGDQSGWKLFSLDLLDVGGGKAADLLLLRRQKKNTPLPVAYQAILYLDPFEGGQVRMGSPDSVAQFESSLASFSLADFNHDGRPDLAMEGWSLTTNLLSLGVEISHVVSGFPAKEKGGFQNRASFQYRRGYKADDFTAFSYVPALTSDLDGDGLTDLLESDPHGVLEMRPFVGEGGRAGFAKEPAFQVAVQALGSVVQVQDLNHDGVGDLLIRHQSIFELYISRKR
ncbi:MAG: hypothetical protein ACE5H3_06240 [Planctomycetota bacterium]